MPSNEFLRSPEGRKKLRDVLKDNFHKFQAPENGVKLYDVEDIYACNEDNGITGRALICVSMAGVRPVEDNGVRKDPGTTLYVDFGLSSDMSRVAYFTHNRLC